MQAHSLSTSAARNHLSPSGPSSPTCRPALPHLPFQAVPVNARSSRSEIGGIAHGPGLAHDAGNLLAALGLYSELLSRPGVLRPEHEHYAEELRGIAQRGSSLMRNLIPHIQPVAASSHPAPMHPAPARNDLTVVLHELRPLLSAIAAPHARVLLEDSPSLLGTGLPADCLERILVNLVRNAAAAIERAHASAPGTIRIALSASSQCLNLTVEDDGPGMPVATAAAFLSPSPLPPGATSGLGHRIVHDLVSSSGGTLTVNVRPCQGTRFTIQWPIDPLHSKQDHPHSTTAPPALLLHTGSHEVSAC